MQDIFIYSDRALAFRTQQQKLAAQVTVTSVIRLLFFVLFAWFLYSAFSNRFQGNDLVYALLSIVALIVMVLIAAGIKKKIRFFEQMILINENEISLSKGGGSFLDNGASFIEKKGFTVDLNVFGKFSLFHLLNRAGSVPGKKQLRNRLASPFFEPADIIHYQQCGKELAGNIHFRQTLLAHTLLLKEENTLVQLQEGISAHSFATLKNKFWSLISFLWPALGVLTVAYGMWTGKYGWSSLVMLLGFLLWGLVFKKVNLLYLHISKRSYLYAQYARCFQLISEEKFEHPYLKQKQGSIQDASRAFKQLAKQIGLFDLRLSVLSPFINGLLLTDLLSARAYLRWNEKYQASIKSWFDTLGEIETLNSLATFHFNHPSFVYPKPATDQLHIVATGMGHPLMKESTAVVNDVSIGDDSTLHIITGSNMSGKSTFLRTLGLNMILAQAGAPVFARSFVFSPVRLLTSFHHIDSLEESTSYFYAELKALKDIIDSLSNSQPALILLDEVMRGTNSKDKHDGTALLIKKLLQHPCMAMIATHDTELGILADEYPGKIQNFCFESTLADDELNFDFTMRNGVAQTKNATYLMQKMGII